VRPRWVASGAWAYALLVLALLLLGVGCAQRTAAADEGQQKAQEAAATSGSQPAKADAATAKAEPVAETPAKSPADPSIQSRKDKLSYAFGVDMARTIQGQKERLNVELLRKALTDALAGNKLVMTDDEVSSTLKTFEAELKQDLDHARKMVAERNKREGEAFFAENAKKKGVVTLPSGLQYKVLAKGSGKVPSREDTVLCNYRGTLLSGAEIDSSYKRKEPMTVPVNGVIAGFAQALQLMPVGSKWQLFIPPQLAYGDRPMPNFGPNSTVVFDVELLGIRDRIQTAQAAANVRDEKAP
jgi:FKBP-type peptidyl-prolyl cis-trans isomerase FklB